MLRARLMLGLMLLLVMLLAMGLYSIDKCGEFGKRIEGVLHSHDEAARNIAQMRGSCVSMSDALLGQITGVPQSEESFSEARSIFGAALGLENGRKGKSDEETKLVAQLQQAFNDYKEKAQASNRTGTNGAAPSTGRLFDLIEKLSEAHKRTIEASTQEGAADITNTTRFIWFLMLMALVATILAWLGLNRGLMAPLQMLTASIRQVGEGNLDQQVPVLDKHELGQLATSFNQMAQQLREYRTTASGELQRLNLTIRSTLASFPDPVFVLNSEGAVEFRNPAADQLAVQLLFSGVTRLPKKVDDKVEDVRKTGEDYLPTLFREAIKFHLNGQDRYFLPRIVLLRDENRAAFGVAVILEDVTRMLLLDDVKSNLISTVSHELKTPLTSVRMVLYLLFEKTVGELNEKQMDLVATAREDADRLLRTLNDLLDLAKLEQGPAQLTLTRVMPRELVEAAVHEARELAAGAGVTLEVEPGPDLPEVEVDRQRIAYVFSNLLTNAVKYSPRGGVVFVSASLGRNRSGDVGVRFAVRDQGPGIFPEHQEHIFERFYRVPGTAKTGAGLGLSIAREVVIAHEGEMGIISSPPNGSEFFFVLPEAPQKVKSN